VFGLDNLIDAIFASATERLTRNERVIKLLKQFKLDPDHPPADFTGVYQYALVEYGVEKPKYVLAIFRQSEIQQLFREALEQNNPSALLRQGEAFLAQNSLGKEIQNHAVDVRREFYEFAAVFIEVAKRTRTPAEILTNQKLESVHRQVGSLQERLNRLPTIEGMRTEMARLAAQDYSALPGNEAESDMFGAERCKAFALAQQMRGWFETLGFRFESHEVWQDDYFEWIINIPVRRGRYDRILVRGIDGEAGLPDVQSLREALETHRTDEGWLVTARRISRAARDEVEKPENDALGCFTFDELLDQDADFSGYLTWLESEIEQRGIDQKYVPLACLKEEIDPDTHQRIGVSRYDDRDGWIDGYIDLWLDDPAKEHISVLGEFGTGKTWFAFHYAWKALQRYRDAQRRGLERPRLPLVVPLRDYAKAVSVESLFSEFFFRKHEIPIPGYSAFEQLNRMGKLLLIFDGFDEMAARVDRQQMINNFWELAKVVVPGAKVILTCRTEHFPEAKEGRALLNAELQASTKDLTGETPQFEVLELEKFNDEQIRRVLSYQAQLATVEQIMGNPELLDLARRPVLTELILEALPDIEAGKPVDMSRVYLYAVRHKMERDIKAERTFTSMADKLYFMCELSWEMLSTDRMSINYREFPDRIRKLFGPAVEEEKDLDHWHYDMMGQTMLIRNAEGDYAPAHRSLIEFFVAYKFVAELGILATDLISLSKKEEISGERSNFYRWSEYFRSLSKNDKWPLEESITDFKMENLSHLKRTVGALKLDKALIVLILFMLNKQTATHNLKKVIHETRNRTEQEVGYVGGNAATLICNFDDMALTGEDLSSTKLIGADFTKANLQNVDFINATLKNCSFSKHLGSVSSVAISSNNKMIAVADCSGAIYIWNQETGKEIQYIEGHIRRIDCVLFFSNDTRLISVGYDNTIRIWNLVDGKCERTLRGHTDAVFCAALNSSRGLIASGGADKSIRLWDVTNGQCMKVLNGHMELVWAVDFSPTENWLASGSYDHEIRIWDIDTDDCIQVLKGHRGWIRSIKFNSKGNILASASEDQTIRLWDINSGQEVKCMRGHSGPIRSIVFSHDDKFLITGSYDQTIRFWNFPEGDCVKVLKDRNNAIRSLSHSKNSNLLVSGSDQTVRLWETTDNICTKTFQGRPNWMLSASFDTSEKSIFAGNSEGFISFWNLNSDIPVKVFRGHQTSISSITPLSEKILASADHEGVIKIWDIPSWKCIKKLTGHNNRVSSISFARSKNLLASAGYDKKIIIWNLVKGDISKTLQGHENCLTSLAFDPDNNFLASSAGDQEIRIWHVESGECRKILRGHKNWIRSVTFNYDGSMIASGASDNTVRLWNSSSGECLKVFEGHKGWIWSAQFSPDGKFVASSSTDKTIRIWEVSSGKLVSTIRGHTSLVISIQFSSDGNLICSSSEDETVRIWKVASGECINVFKLKKQYEGMNVTGVKGLTPAEIDKLKMLGAIQDEVVLS